MKIIIHVPNDFPASDDRVGVHFETDTLPYEVQDADEVPLLRKHILEDPELAGEQVAEQVRKIFHRMAVQLGKTKEKVV